MLKPSLAFWNTLLWAGLFVIFIAAFGVLMACGKKSIQTQQVQMPQSVSQKEATASALSSMKTLLP